MVCNGGNVKGIDGGFRRQNCPGQDFIGYTVNFRG